MVFIIYSFANPFFACKRVKDQRSCSALLVHRTPLHHAVVGRTNIQSVFFRTRYSQHFTLVCQELCRPLLYVFAPSFQVKIIRNLRWWCNNLFVPLLILIQSPAGRHMVLALGTRRTRPAHISIRLSPSELRSNCGRAHDPGRRAISVLATRIYYSYVHSGARFTGLWMRCDDLHSLRM